MVFKTYYRFMQVKSIAECSAILLTFIKLPFAVRIFVLSIFEWSLKTGFTVHLFSGNNRDRCIMGSRGSHSPHLPEGQPHSKLHDAPVPRLGQLC